MSINATPRESLRIIRAANGYMVKLDTPEFGTMLRNDQTMVFENMLSALLYVDAHFEPQAADTAKTANLTALMSSAPVMRNDALTECAAGVPKSAPVHTRASASVVPRSFDEILSEHEAALRKQIATEKVTGRPAAPVENTVTVEQARNADSAKSAFGFIASDLINAGTDTTITNAATGEQKKMVGIDLPPFRGDIASMAFPANPFNKGGK